jgi:hypothetical protein
VTVLNYVTITGEFADGQDNPLSGSATFCPNVTVYASGVPLLQPDVPVQAQITDGQLTNLSGEPLTLLTTDNSSIEYQGQTGFFFWTVQVVISGQTLDPWSFFLPHEPSTVDLWSLANTVPGASGILPPAGDIGGTTGDPEVVSTHLADPMPLNQGGTGVNAASNAALLTALGLGSAATEPSSAFDAAGSAASAQAAAETFAASAVAAETTRAETAEALKAPLASPAFTGSPAAPTQTAGDTSTKIATDAFVATAVATETARAETAEAGKLALSGGTMTGPLEISTGTTGNMLAVGGAPTATTEALEIVSSASQQNRLKMASFFETDNSGTAEVTRMHFGQATGNGAAGGDSSKAALAWYDDTISTSQAQVWVQAHNYLHQYDPQAFAPSGVNTGTGVITYTPAGIPPINAWQVQFSTTGTLPGGLAASTNYYVDTLTSGTFSVYNDSGLTEPVTLTSQGTGTHTMTPQLSYSNNHHQHFSVEVTDSTLSTKSTRFSIPWGFTTTEAGFFGANLTVNSGTLRVCGGSGSARTFVLGNTLSNNLTPDGTQNRWSLSANSTAESGSNTGSDFALSNYSDTGVQLGSPLFIQRSTGYVGIAGVVTPGAQLDVGLNSAATNTIRINRGTNGSYFASLTFDTSGTDEWSVQNRNDSTNDLYFRDVANGLNAVILHQNSTQPSIALLGTPSYGGGTGVVFLANASTPPSSNPTGGGVLYSSSGTLSWMGSSGPASGLAMLTGAAYTGAVSVSESASAGGVLAVTNTHSTPSAPTVRLTANAAADVTFGIEVTGDADYRFTSDSNGLLSWGSGTAAADVTLSRTAIGILTVGGSLDVTSSGTTGIDLERGTTSNFASMTFDTGGTDYWSIQLRNDSTNDLHIRDVSEGLDGIYIQHRATILNLGLLGQPASSNFGGGAGVVFIPNASTLPTGAPASGAFLYVNAGALYCMGTDGTATKLSS